MNTTTMRVRWAAIGAAVAVTLGAGGLHVAGATLSSGERTSFVAINPCRLADTRPGSGDNIGTRNAPLGAEDTFVLDGTGDHGNCHNAVPATASALSLNVTAIGPTVGTFLTIYPTGEAQPVTSNLNPAPGSPPTPNAVTVDLNAGGQFSIFNKVGSVNVIVDVVGFYESHDHDDRYYTKSQADANVAGAVSTAISTHNHDSRYYTKGQADANVESATQEPDHITGVQILDGSLSMFDLTGPGAPFIIPLTNPGDAFGIDANGCVVESVSLGSSNAYRLLVPIAVGIGISGSAGLSAFPVSLNVSGLGAILICNQVAFPFNTTQQVDLDYRLI